MRLKALSARIDRSVGQRGDITSLSFQVVLDNRLDRLDLATGEVVRNPRSYIYIELKEPNPDLFVSVSRESRGRAPIDEGIGRVGTVVYTEPWDGEDGFIPSSVSFRLYLSDDDYKELLDAALHAVMPKTFWLDRIEGMEERGPEGNDKRWNNKATPVLPVDGVSWNYEIAAPAPPAGEPAPAAPSKKAESNRDMWVMFAVTVALAVVIGWFFRN